MIIENIVINNPIGIRVEKKHALKIDLINKAY